MRYTDVDSSLEVLVLEIPLDQMNLLRENAGMVSVGFFKWSQLRQVRLLGSKI